MYWWTSAAEIAQNVRSGNWSAKLVIDNILTRIITENTRLNAFTSVLVERARDEANRVDQLVAAGQDPGPLAGVPFAVKNLFDIQGEVTLAGSKINRDLPPARKDATVIQRLAAAGAVLVGALNMGEYAYDFTGENVHYGASRNPHNINRMSGGSSGGCGSAVAGGLVPIALGSDTNGSIRVPSSLCGIFGLKPTYGRLSRGGSFPFCPSLDHVGLMARNVMDIAIVYDILQGYDDRDTSLANHPIELVGTLSDTLDKSIRIAIVGGYFAKYGTYEAQMALQKVADVLGVKKTIEIPEVEAARAAAYVITNAESSALHLSNLRIRPGDFDPDVRDRMLAGSLLPASVYVQAQRVRARFKKVMSEIFSRYDILLAPSTPMTAPLISQRYMRLDDVEMLVRPHLGIYTQPFSLVGLPVVSIPVYLHGSLPIGIQVVGPPWQEGKILQLSYILEREGFISKRPEN